MAKPKTIKPKATWHVYIIRCGDGSLYTGITLDIERRMLEHKLGTGAKYTRGRAPFKLLHTEKFRNRSKASARECTIKKLSREEKLELVGG